MTLLLYIHCDCNWGIVISVLVIVISCYHYYCCATVVFDGISLVAIINFFGKKREKYHNLFVKLNGSVPTST